jgi:hypothetical protein
MKWGLTLLPAPTDAASPVLQFPLRVSFAVGAAGNLTDTWHGGDSICPDQFLQTGIRFSLRFGLAQSGPPTLTDFATGCFCFENLRFPGSFLRVYSSEALMID